MTGSYNVQDCDVSSDQHTSSILVQCTFAINSTAPGIVEIQDDQSRYTINKTLQRLLQDSDKGSVNITGLPAGEYSVRVYDNSPATDSTSAAYQHSQLIHIMGLAVYPDLSNSQFMTHSNSIQGILIILLILSFVCVFIDKPSSSNTSPARSPSQHDIINNNNTIILASSIATGLLLLLLLVILIVVITSIVCAAHAMKKKQHTRGICMINEYTCYNESW